MGVWKESHNDFQADHGSVACRYVHGQMSAAKLCVQKYTNQILGQRADLLQSRHLWLSPKRQCRYREGFKPLQRLGSRTDQRLPFEGDLLKNGQPHAHWGEGATLSDRQSRLQTTTNQTTGWT